MQNLILLTVFGASQIRERTFKPLVKSLETTQIEDNNTVDLEDQLSSQKDKSVINC